MALLRAILQVLASHMRQLMTIWKQEGNDMLNAEQMA